jgi:hypothetical protein
MSEDMLFFWSFRMGKIGTVLGLMALGSLEPQTLFFYLSIIKL